MAVGEDEEQTADFEFATAVEECREAARAERGEPFEHHIEVMEALLFRQFVEGFEDRALRGGYPHSPTPRQFGRARRLVFGEAEIGFAEQGETAHCYRRVELKAV